MQLVFQKKIQTKEDNVSQQTFPALPQRGGFDPALRLTDGPLDALHRVFSICMPLFSQSMESLAKGSPLDLFRQRPWV